MQRKAIWEQGNNCVPQADATARRIIDRCRALGFAAAGVCNARPSDYVEHLRKWLAAGKHSSMDYLPRHEALRVDPTRVLPGARSIIMVADLYHARGVRADVARAASAKEEPSNARASASTPSTSASLSGRIARYARGSDYHDIVKKRLHALADELRGDHPLAEFRAFVDTAPVMEREHAARAGMGWVGKHTLLIHPRLGSYTLLGGVLTTLELTPPQEQKPTPDHCGTCTRCIDACPTRAITPYSVDASRCIAYLTIERRGAIDPKFHEQIGDWIFGCDVCQEVCPHNSPRPRDPGHTEPRAVAHRAYTPRREGFDLLEVLRWKAEDRSQSFAGTALRRATLEMMKRNAIIALANAEVRGDISRSVVIDRLQSIVGDPMETELVAQTALAILRRLGA